MKYSLILAFGASALAQNYTQAPAQNCVETIETATVYDYITVCPCSSTTSTLATGNATSTATSSGYAGTGVSDGPVLNSRTTTTTATLSGTASSLTSSVSTASSVTSSITPSSSGISSTEVGTPLTFTSSPTSTGTAATTNNPLSSSTTTTTSTTTNSASSASNVPPASSTSYIALSSLSSDYQTRALYAHNLHRANASIPALTWSATMAQYAQQIAATCVYGHSNAAGDGNYGQNIGAGFTPDQIPVMITNNMYNNEINYYPGPYGQDNIDTSNFGRWGHYSQLVWRDTTQVGCATQYCPNGLANTGSGIQPYFTVCNYSPPGNYDGSWSRVAQPLGGGTVVFT